MWSRTDVDFIQSQDVPWEPVPEGAFGSGGARRVLSRDPEDGAMTAIMTVGHRQKGILLSAADVYVLAGTGTVNDRRVAAGQYLFLPSESFVDLRPVTDTIVLYVGTFGAPVLRPGEGQTNGRDIRHVALERISWTTPEWRADQRAEPGIMVKPIRQDALGLAFVVAMLPGWRSELEEVHPIYEESFRLLGDFMMGPRGVIRAGGYFFRSPGITHGPLYTRTGTMSLIRTSGPITTEYREPAPEHRWEELAARAYADFPFPLT